ncbi:cyclic nucleotide-binding/CBS domain-containing protein [Phenylobacterium sp.]|uniref:CBS domain-containing protein n=1 Tax=Phenylobacterium sp. TaxID=1871053 RepID=UPI00356AA077
MFVEKMLHRARERLVVIEAGATVRQAAELMSKPHVALIVVIGPDGRMVGVVTKTDLVAQMRRCGGEACNDRVDTIMTRDVLSCRANELLHDVWLVVKSRGLLRLPLLDADARPIGILYARDALPILLTEAEDEEKMLRDYVMNVGYQ